MTQYRIVHPDGYAEYTGDVTFSELLETDERVAHIISGCPDVFGYLLVNLETGYITDPVEVRQNIEGKYSGKGVHE